MTMKTFLNVSKTQYGLLIRVLTLKTPYFYSSTYNFRRKQDTFTSKEKVIQALTMKILKRNI